jgi:urease accessory protein
MMTKELAMQDSVQPSSGLDAVSLLRLLTLSSTALPVGAYCYSQGAESAIEYGLIRNEQTALAYFQDVFELLLVRYELPMLAQLIQAASGNDGLKRFYQLSTGYKASRESREFLAESQQLAFSLNAWIRDVLRLDVQVDAQYGFVPVYAQLAVRLNLKPVDCLAAYSFSVLENQVLAVVKTLPLGQMSGQRILWALHHLVPDGVQRALSSQRPLSNSLPNYAMLSMQHETQYSRLFRS